MSITQYLKDTRAELHHVAWPTRLQTIIYTTLVVALSITIALYLGFFDFIFTTSLSRALLVMPKKTTTSAISATTSPTSAISVTTSTPATSER